MYTFKPTLGEQMLFHCEETLTKNLGWNERPLYPLHCREVGIGSPRHDFDAWVLGREREKTEVCFFRRRIGDSCVGVCRH